jgi:toxin-antitoxin system PIN domain toxin
VIVVDVNLLIYAVDQGAPHHEGAHHWWLSMLAGRETIGLPWSTVLAFARLTTNPRVFTHPLTTDQAFDLLEAWTAHHHVVPVEPTPRHLPLVRGFLEATGTAGNLVTDAHLAAIAVEYGATLCSADADFIRFPGLKWTNPLAKGRPPR